MSVRSSENPKISVLVPVYNTPEQYLREAIDSILAQTFTDFELIILNDASTDTTVERTVESYDDPRIRYFTNPRNLGISATRNKLMDLARGEYLAVMDHDDISLPERFEKEAAYLDENPEVGLVSSAATILNGKIGELRFPINDDEIRLGLLDGNKIIHSASMLRKSVLDSHGIRYEAEYSPAEDYALCCRLIPYTHFHNLPEILFCYRFHATNTSLVWKEKMDRMALAVQSRVRADNPALFNLYLALAPHTTKVKLFGFIPFLKTVKRGNRTTCTVFGLPLYRSKKKSELFP